MSNLAPTTVTEPRPAYRYRDRDLNILHTTSAPRDEDEAFKYFEFVERWLPTAGVQYIEKRDVGAKEYHFLKYEYRDGKVVPM